MKDDYLWNAKGEPDEDLRELEGLLRPYRWKGGLRDLDAEGVKWNAPWWRRPATGWIAAAAAILLVAGFLFTRGEDRVPAEYSYEVLSGVPRIEGGAAGGDGQVLREGQVLWCDAETRVELRIGDIGLVELEPETRMRVENPADGDDPEAQHLLFLERGTMLASIFSAPRLFQVATPAGITVDLGCIYSATVEADGVTRLCVQSGQVAFETAGRRVLVPAGASTRAYPERGPATPTWDDAAPEFRDAVLRVDLLHDSPSLEQALDLARVEDSLTLWHWFDLPRSELRERVYQKLAELAPPPAGVTRAGVLAGDRRQLDAWKDAQGWSW